MNVSIGDLGSLSEDDLMKFLSLRVAESTIYSPLAKQSTVKVQVHSYKHV